MAYVESNESTQASALAPTSGPPEGLVRFLGTEQAPTVGADAGPGLWMPSGLPSNRAGNFWPTVTTEDVGMGGGKYVEGDFSSGGSGSRLMFWTDPTGVDFGAGAHIFAVFGMPDAGPDFAVLATHSTDIEYPGGYQVLLSPGGSGQIAYRTGTRGSLFWSLSGLPGMGNGSPHCLYLNTDWDTQTAVEWDGAPVGTGGGMTRPASVLGFGAINWFTGTASGAPRYRQGCLWILPASASSGDLDAVRSFLSATYGVAV